MKIAALILAHHGPELLFRLVQKLIYMDMKVYVSLDMNSNADVLHEKIAGLDLTVLRSERPRRWGGFRIVEDTLALVKVALEDEAIGGFMLMSGDTYPIRAGHICDIFDVSRDSIESFEVNANDTMFKRISKTYAPDSRLGAFNLQSKSDLERFVDEEFMIQVESLRNSLQLKSARTFQWKLGKGSQWWFLRRTTLLRCLEALEENDEMLTWFRYSSIPDESFFQTLVLNFCNDNPSMTTPVFVDWTQATSPHTYRSVTDLATLRSRPEPFARKFSNEHLEVIDAIDNWWH